MRVSFLDRKLQVLHTEKTENTNNDLIPIKEDPFVYSLFFCHCSIDYHLGNYLVIYCRMV